ncbi:hypothetical protein AT705_22665 [Pseudoalteromonas rubra]|uniref:Uncharacterized protein n=1 Tax=Pseudoalteromonas rubra TaxID=43658 RepID=A0A0U3GRU0_9GAMM|nr:hypothetical protein AT705_22665 [Pseudoalteromonas rubra]
MGLRPSKNWPFAARFEHIKATAVIDLGLTHMFFDSLIQRPALVACVCPRRTTVYLFYDKYILISKVYWL